MGEVSQFTFPDTPNRRAALRELWRLSSDFRNAVVPLGANVCTFLVGFAYVLTAGGLTTQAAVVLAAATGSLLFGVAATVLTLSIRLAYHEHEARVVRDYFAWSRAELAESLAESDKFNAEQAAWRASLEAQNAAVWGEDLDAEAAARQAENKAMRERAAELQARLDQDDELMRRLQWAWNPNSWERPTAGPGAKRDALYDAAFAREIAGMPAADSYAQYLSDAGLPSTPQTRKQYDEAMRRRRKPTNSPTKSTNSPTN